MKLYTGLPPGNLSNLSMPAIDDSARFYGQTDRLVLSPGCRIDAQVIITVGTDGVMIHEAVHIGAGAYLFGAGAAIIVSPHCSISPRAMLFTSTDRMDEDVLIGTQAPRECRSVKTGAVILRPFAAIGAGAIVFPGVTLGEGAVVGALSIVKRDVPPWHVVVGPDQRTIRVRDAARVKTLLAASR